MESERKWSFYYIKDGKLYENLQDIPDKKYQYVVEAHSIKHAKELAKYKGLLR
jgi:hypothetical protein